MAGQLVTPGFDIIGFGAVAVDEMICAERYPPPDSKARVLKRERHCGGLTAIALIAAARLGLKCAYAGTLGKDELSDFAIAQMQKGGVNLKYLLRRAGARPVYSVIVVDERRGTRNIFCDIPSALGAANNWPPAKVIRSARVVLVDFFGIAGMIRAARIARDAGIPVVGDFELEGGSSFLKLMRLVDHLILSQSVAEKVTGEKVPALAAKALWTNERSVVAVTCGEKGCWFVAADVSRRAFPGRRADQRRLTSAATRAQHQPAFKVRAVDTTGCGDVFHGAYAAALARGMAVNDRFRFASAAAALKAAKAGAEQGIPTLRQVQRFLRSQA